MNRSLENSIREEELDLDKYLIELDRFVFFGSAHVSKKSKKILEYAFKKYDFKAVALELDLSRFIALMNDEKPSFKYVFKIQNGFFWYILSKIQRSFAKKFNTSLGEEMKIATEFAKSKEIPIYLIDLPIEIVMKKMKKIINIKFLFKLFISSFRKQKLRVKIDKINDFVDLDYEEVKELLDIFKKEFPEIYKILIEERNKFMANNLLKIMKEMDENEKILVVVGKGHIPGLLEILNSKNFNMKKD